VSGSSLDRIDRKILHELMRNSALPIAQLADRVGLSQTPCWKRVQKLEAAGIITGRVALVDPAKIGLGLTAFVEIEADEHTPEWRDRFNTAVASFAEIMEVHRMAGHADYLLKVIVADTAAFDEFYLRFTDRINCRKVTSKFSMETMRMSTTLPVDTQKA